MKKLILLALSFLFLLLITTSSCNQKNNEGLLWRISGKNLENPSYLLGTNHGMHYYYLDSIAGAWQAFNSVNQLVSEILLEDTTIIQHILKENIDILGLNKDKNKRNKSIYLIIVNASIMMTFNTWNLSTIPSPV